MKEIEEGRADQQQQDNQNTFQQHEQPQLNLLNVSLSKDSLTRNILPQLENETSKLDLDAAAANLDIQLSPEHLQLPVLGGKVQSFNILLNPMLVQKSEGNQSGDGGGEDSWNRARSVNSAQIKSRKDLQRKLETNVDEQRFQKSLSKGLVPSFRKQKTKPENKVSIAQNKILGGANKKVLAKILKSRLMQMNMATIQNPQDNEATNKLGGIFGQFRKKLLPGMFQVHGQTVFYDKRSLYMLSSLNPIRKGIVWFIEWKLFEIVVFNAITANTVVIALYDQMDHVSATSYNQTLDHIQQGLTVFFTIEALLKIIGMGFIMHHRSYLRDQWNWLDLFTVIVGWLEYLPNIPSLKFFRALRVLRPLRSIRAIPGLRRLISSLLQSLKLLANVVTFLLFFVIFFGIVGVAVFKGQDYNRCYMTESPEANDTWFKDSNQLRVCDLDNYEDGYQCSAGTYCRNPEHYGEPFADCSDDQVNLYGINSFDHLLAAISTIFQVLTLEGWTKIMYNMQDAGFVIQSPLYFLLIVIFGGFFILNLILAAIMDSFDKVDKEMAIEEMKKEFHEVEAKAVKTIEHFREKIIKRMQTGMLSAMSKPLSDPEESSLSPEKGRENFLNPDNEENQAPPGSSEPPDIGSFKLSIAIPGLPNQGSKVQQHEIEIRMDSIFTDDLMEEKDLKKSKKNKNKPKDQSKTEQLNSQLNIRKSPTIYKESLEDWDLQPPQLEQKKNSKISNQISQPNKASKAKSENDSSDSDDQDSESQQNQIQSKNASPLSMTHVKKLKHVVIEQNLTYNDEQMEEIELRKANNWFYSKAFSMARSRYFTSFILFVILMNTLVLFLDRYPMPDGEQNVLDLLNQIFLAVFMLEMVVKVLAFGPKNYLKDRFNIFDVIVIIFSLIDVIIVSEDTYQSSLVAFRAFRFLRIFKIARQWRSLQIIIQKISKSFKEMMNFLILLALFILVYGLLGMELYANLIKFDDNNEPVKCKEGQLKECQSLGNSPKVNFDNLGAAMSSVFIIIIGDDWNATMADYIRATSHASEAYFTTLTIFGNIILLNLFLAILLRQFEDKTFEDKYEQSEVQKILDQLSTTSKKIGSRSGIWCKTNVIYPICPKLLNLFNNKSSILNQSSGRSGEHLDAEEDYDSIFKSQKNVNSSEKRDGQMKEVVRPIDDAREIFDFDDISPAQMQESRQRNELILKGKTVTNQDLALVSRDRQIADQTFFGNDDQSFEDNEGDQADKTFNELIQTQCLKRSPQISDEHFADLAPSNKHALTMRPNFKGDATADIIQEESVTSERNNFDEQQNAKISVIASKEKGSRSSNSKSGNYSNLFSQTLGQKSYQDLYSLLHGHSLWIFSPKNSFRILCCYIVKSKLFQSFIFLLVILSTVNLAIQDPLSDPSSDFNMIIYYIDLSFSIVFALECLLKIVSRGFLFNGSNSYLLNPWSRVDFIVVILSLISFTSTQNTKVTKLLRNLRVVRPLRLIPKNNGLKIAVESLFNSIKGLVNITILTFFMFFVWGIYGVTFFKGLYYKCYNDHILTTNAKAMFDEAQTKWDCISLGGEWIKRKNTFDNVFYAALTLFQVSTTEGWVDVMTQVVDSTGIDLMPAPSSNPYGSLYFTIFILMGGLFSMNLFQGVVISTYLNEKEKLSNNHLLTDMQREWMKIQIKCYKSKPKVVSPNMKSAFRKSLILFTNKRSFDYCIYICILINTVILSCNWYGMPDQLEQAFNIINHIFTGIFSLEALLKIIGFGRLYFKKFWNVFDFFILIITILQILNGMASFTKEFTAYATVLRVLKLLKTARLFKKAQNFKNIIKTLLVTIPNLANIALLLFLLQVFYAITGMNVFGRVMLHNALTVQANFQTFPNAFLTMMRCSTGESWNDIMAALMDSNSVLFQCIDYPTYEDIQNNNGDAIACGSYWPSLIFFLSHQMLVCQIFLNLFIAIILDGFDDSKQDLELRIDDQTIKQFKEAWAVYDPEGSGFISIEDLEDLIYQLIINHSGWVRGGDILLTSPKQLKSFISLLELPMYNHFRHLNYYDVISRLAQTVFKVDFERFIIDSEYENLPPPQKPQSKSPKSEKHSSNKLVDALKQKKERDQQQTVLKRMNEQHGLKKLDAVGSPRGSRHRKSVIYNDDQQNLEEGDKIDGDGEEQEMNQGDTMLKWMEVKDHLLFETFDEFYKDLQEKLSDSKRRIALNEDLKRQVEWREKGLEKLRSRFDSRIILVVPVLIKQMRALANMMRTRQFNNKDGEEDPLKAPTVEKIQKLSYISQEMIDARVKRKKEDLYQILAKTFREEILSKKAQKFQSVKTQAPNKKASKTKVKKVPLQLTKDLPNNQFVRTVVNEPVKNIFLPQLPIVEQLKEEDQETPHSNNARSISILDPYEEIAQDKSFE